MSKEIKEIEPKRFPSFPKACKQLSMDDIFTMAEATYRLQVARCGGVIDE